MNNGIMIEGRGIVKIYNEGLESEVNVLRGINIKIKKGEMIAVMGPSGSGKTTLLDVVGCLLKPTSGQVLIEGVDVYDLLENEIAEIRRKKIGFVFQQYNLIPSFTALENVELPMRIAGMSKLRAQSRARSLLTTVGLAERVNHKPSELSGGEQQRVAIARSLANNPKIIMGDEPTGNLDSNTGKKVLELLRSLNKKEGYTLIMVSHDPRIREYVNKVINLMDGKIIKEEET
jgi:putative ABC transport system ATP-binding protein